MRFEMDAPTTQHPVPQGLPREVIKWIQSLDLSYSIRNVKRDFANGFLIAEIFSRYYPQDLSMHTFENGTKAACRKDNWEQLFRFFKRRSLPIGRSDFEPVINTAPGAAVSVLVKCYTLLTRRSVPVFVVQEIPPDSVDNGSPTATEKKAVSLDPALLDMQQHPATQLPESASGQDAYRVFQAARSNKPVERSAPKAVGERREPVPLDIPEVKARSVTKNVAQLRAQHQQQVHQANLQKSRATTSMSGRRSSVGTDVGPSTPSLGYVGSAKTVVDLMRPIVSQILQGNDRVMKSMDPRKDVVASFMELCRTHVPEDVSVRVFDALSNQANILADVVLRSPAEFWRVWTLCCPALVEFSESSPVFESVVYFFKRLGALMAESEPVLTQQLAVEAMISSLAPLLVEVPGKREPLCELVYAYTQPAVLSRLAVLRAMKEAVRELPVYITCLSYLVPLELRSGQLEEHLREHAMYYALMALQSPQPRIRVAGLSILVAVTASSEEHSQRALALLPSFTELVHDAWWEVQAQLMLLASHLLAYLARKAEASGGAGASGSTEEETVESLLLVVSRLFGVPGTSKIVLQVGLCSMVKGLRPYPSLLPAYVAALLRQPAGFRKRLLQSGKVDDLTALTPAPPRKLAYVIGTCSRLYEECCICEHWPALEIARTLAGQAEASQLANFEPEHLEVISACLPEPYADLDDDWLAVFEKVKAYVFVALVDPILHQGATDIIRRFWLCRPQGVALRAIETSRKTMLQTLRMNYGDAGHARVQERELLDFLREMREAGGAVAATLQAVVDQFREAHNAEFQRSSLDTLFG